MRDIILVFIAGLTMVIFSFLFSGCATVKSYEREHLADRIMDFDAIWSNIEGDLDCDETEADMIWGAGQRYFSQVKGKLVV